MVNLRPRRSSEEEIQTAKAQRANKLAQYHHVLPCPYYQQVIKRSYLNE